MTRKFENDLKNFETPDAAQVLDNLLGLRSPWIQGDAAMNCKHWAQAVCGSLRFEALGRFLFPVLLKYICDRFISEPAMFVNERVELADTIKDWKPTNAEQLIEKTFLLKELYVGRRELQMPAWAGQVSGKLKDLDIPAEKKREQQAKKDMGTDCESCCPACILGSI